MAMTTTTTAAAKRPRAQDDEERLVADAREAVRLATQQLARALTTHNADELLNALRTFHALRFDRGPNLRVLGGPACDTHYMPLLMTASRAFVQAAAQSDVE